MWCAFSTIRVLALAISRPVSTMVVHTNTSYSRSQNPWTVRSNTSSLIWPCATTIRASGTRFRSSRAFFSISDTLLCTKNTWPSRNNSRRIAAAICLSSCAPTYVKMGCRSSGGVKIVDISRMPAIDISSVRGIGVADMVSTSTCERMALMCSLCSTPNRCSSSTTTRPNCFHCTPVCNSRCVPITISTDPSRSPDRISFASDADVNRDNPLIVTGKPAIRSANVAKCCCANNVVGTNTATCLPSCTALNAARTATSVLP